MEEKYREIQTFGAVCYTDAYICNTDSQIYMMSLFGRSGIVNAISATIITGIPVSILLAEGLHTIKRSYLKYRINTCNFEGLCHKIIMVDTLFNSEEGEMIIADNDKDRIFHFIDSRVTTPLKAEWVGWMIDQGLASYEPLISFDGTGKMDKEYGLFCAPESEATDKITLEGIREGNIQ